MIEFSRAVVLVGLFIAINGILSHGVPLSANDSDQPNSTDRGPIGQATQQAQDDASSGSVLSPNDSASNEPALITFASDAVGSEEQFEEVLDALRRLANGTAVLAPSTTTTTTTTTSTTQRPIAAGSNPLMARPREMRPHAAYVVLARAARRRAEEELRSLWRWRNLNGFANWLQPQLEPGQSVESLHLDPLELARLQSLFEEDQRRESLRRDPEHIKQVEEFLQSKKNLAASEVNSEIREAGQDSECAICMEANSPAESVELDCHHTFHLACLKNWFTTIVDTPAKTCPVCRKPHLMDKEE